MVPENNSAGRIHCRNNIAVFSFSINELGISAVNKVASTVSHVEVTGDHAGQRLDNFLSSRLKGLPRSVIYRMIRTGQARVNGGRAKPATRLDSGDMVRIPPASVRENVPGKIPPAVQFRMREEN